MCPLQLRKLLFVGWVVGYVAFLLSIKRMWTGKYIRNPVVRSLLVNMLSDLDTIDVTKVGYVRMVLVATAGVL